jgi:hypothetical protein
MERARKDPQGKMRSLCHHIDKEALKRSFRRIRSNATVGVDRVTKKEYGQGLDQRI